MCCMLFVKHGNPYPDPTHDHGHPFPIRSIVKKTTATFEESVKTLPNSYRLCMIFTP